MKKVILRAITISTIIVFIVPSSFNIFLSTANAISSKSPSIVINEVAWAGSHDSSSDEWIELYNNTNETIDLSSWKILDNDNKEYILPDEKKIKGKGYFLLIDNESAIKDPENFHIINLSLVNSGKNLILKDKDNQTIDQVLASDNWFAGESKNKASMERIDSEAIGDASNFSTAITSNGKVSSGGSAILGTPGSQNSVSIDEENRINVSIESVKDTYKINDIINLDFKVNNVIDLKSYGIEIEYDKNHLTFINTEKGDFLNKYGEIQSEYISGLENNIEGKLIIGEAILNKSLPGQTGAGSLFKISFKVKDIDNIKNTKLFFHPRSYLANNKNDLLAFFQPHEISFTKPNSDLIKDIKIELSKEKYHIKLSWDKESTPVDIYKKLPNNKYEKIGSSPNGYYTDKSNIIIGNTYYYKLVKRKEDLSEAEELSIIESRGLKGDINKDDRIDFRDLQLLSLNFGSKYKDQGYNSAIDLDYSGEIDGSDLLLISQNWGKSKN